jgi:hypothetical protein
MVSSALQTVSSALHTTAAIASVSSGEGQLVRILSAAYVQRMQTYFGPVHQN